MANEYIYFLVIIVANSRPSEMYFLNDDLGTNLPDRFGDPIDENWQDKRSADQTDYSRFSNKFDNFPNIEKEYADNDYRNGNGEAENDEEIQQNVKMEKREKMKRNFNEPFNEAYIKRTLSKLSNSDREALNTLMNEETSIDVDKRELLKRNFENDFHLNKRNNFKTHCRGMLCEGYDQTPLRKESPTEEENYMCPEKVSSKRNFKYKRSNKFHSTSHENILQAKVSLLKDNYKRNSEMQSLEESAKRRANNNENRDGYRQKRSLRNEIMNFAKTS